MAWRDVCLRSQCPDNEIYEHIFKRNGIPHTLTSNEIIIVRSSRTKDYKTLPNLLRSNGRAEGPTAWDKGQEKWVLPATITSVLSNYRSVPHAYSIE